MLENTGESEISTEIGSRQERLVIFLKVDHLKRVETNQIGGFKNDQCGNWKPRRPKTV